MALLMMAGLRFSIVEWVKESSAEFDFGGKFLLNGIKNLLPVTIVNGMTRNKKSLDTGGNGPLYVYLHNLSILSDY